MSRHDDARRPVFHRPSTETLEEDRIYELPETRSIMGRERDSDSRGSVSSNEWAASEVDTSVLSAEKLRKLKKKGINPALYIEMKAARKGKSKWLSPLQGNSFVM